mmetsp:Transcript_10892/g.34476  ORF Transcript_10892/g.34476 Transcript_10892/m.34476 type:complete len:216 (-) Transcript_10892:40-687(-)
MRRTDRSRATPRAPTPRRPRAGGVRRGLAAARRRASQRSAAAAPASGACLCARGRTRARTTRSRARRAPRPRRRSRKRGGAGRGRASPTQRPAQRAERLAAGACPKRAPSLAGCLRPTGPRRLRRRRSRRPPRRGRSRVRSPARPPTRAGATPRKQPRAQRRRARGRYAALRLRGGACPSPPTRHTISRAAPRRGPTPRRGATRCSHHRRRRPHR